MLLMRTRTNMGRRWRRSRSEPFRSRRQRRHTILPRFMRWLSRCWLHLRWSDKMMPIEPPQITGEQIDNHNPHAWWHDTRRLHQQTKDRTTHVQEMSQHPMPVHHSPGLTTRGFTLPTIPVQSSIPTKGDTNDLYQERTRYQTHIPIQHTGGGHIKWVDSKTGKPCDMQSYIFTQNTARQPHNTSSNRSSMRTWHSSKWHETSNHNPPNSPSLQGPLFAQNSIPPIFGKPFSTNTIFSYIRKSLSIHIFDHMGCYTKDIGLMGWLQ